MRTWTGSSGDEEPTLRALCLIYKLAVSRRLFAWLIPAPSFPPFHLYELPSCVRDEERILHHYAGYNSAHCTPVQRSSAAAPTNCTVEKRTCILKPIGFFSFSLSLSRFLSSTSLQSYHVPPSCSGPPPLPSIHPSPSAWAATGKEREGEECGWMWTTCRQSASKVFSRSFPNSLAADWVSITRIPALLSVAVWIRETGEERQTMGNATGLRYSAKDFHT